MDHHVSNVFNYMWRQVQKKWVAGEMRKMYRPMTHHSASSFPLPRYLKITAYFNVNAEYVTAKIADFLHTVRFCPVLTFHQAHAEHRMATDAAGS